MFDIVYYMHIGVMYNYICINVCLEYMYTIQCVLYNGDLANQMLALFWVISLNSMHITIYTMHIMYNSE